jgi:cyclopropane fatty-acyl-phospholipid synthase-like methyltransferase
MLNMTKILKRIYINSRYLFHPPWDTGIPAPEIVRFIQDKKPGNAIDIGCGTGTNLLYLAQHGWRVTGVDFAWLAIQKAKRKLKKYCAELLVSDVSRLNELNLTGPFDLALDMGCFHSLQEWERRQYVQGVERWIKPGGMYMLYAFQPSENSSRWGISQDNIMAYFKDKFVLIHYEQGEGRPSAWYYFRRK